MALMDLFKGAKISNPRFKLKDENVGELINNTTCVFYLEGNGINCTPLVKKGEEVKKGQVIGQEKDDFSIPLISSVSGIVVDVKEITNIQGNKIKAIVVGEITNCDNKEEEVKIDSLSKEELLSKLQEFGLSDINGLPLSLKYRAFEGNKVIVSSFNKEVNLCKNEVLVKKEAAFNKGLEVINQIVINAEVKKVHNEEVTEKTVQREFGVETKDKDVVIEDLSTIVYIGECFLTGTPKTYEYITVFGSAVEGNKVIKVKLGTTLEDLFKGLQGKENELSKTIVGGALNGTAQFTLECGITQNTAGVLFLDNKEGKKGTEISCIRCSKCLRACPEGLNPIKLAELWRRGEKEEYLKFGGKKCSECGLCSYVCPSNIELAHKLRTANNFIK
ncbi:MAG: 4Fe-4S dicluster domain-containing protein [Clostridium sp.]